MKSKCLSFVGIIFVWGCGASPLLHHRNAGDESRTSAPEASVNANENKAPTPAAVKCPINFPKTGLCASLTWDTLATADSEGAFTLRFWNKNLGKAEGPYVMPPHMVAVKLWMPSMGHGSSPVMIQPSPEPGVYPVTRVYFVMPGEWQILVQLKDGRELFEEAIVDLTI